MIGCLAIILVTHDPQIAQHTDRIVHLHDVRVSDEQRAAQVLQAQPGT
jgi:ABC-type lipoprotein export system ATPase subunit